MKNFSSSRYRGLSLVFFLLFSSSGDIAWAQNWDPFPRLRSGQQAAVSPDLQAMGWTELQSCLRNIRSSVGARYYAAVVEISAANGSDSPQFSNAVPYVDALYQDWRRRNRLDPSTHVLIALSLRNRGIAIHPGTRWVDLGFANNMITETIDQSRFGTLARSGEFSQAICALAEAVDARLASFQQALQARRDAITGDLAKWQREADALEARLSEDSEFAPPLVENARESLVRINLNLASGRAAVDNDRLGEAKALSPQLGAELGTLVSQLDAAVEARRALPELETSRAEIEQRLQTEVGVEKGVFDPARASITHCSALLAEGQDRLAKGLAVDLAGVKQCLERTEEEIERGRSLYQLLYVQLPRWLTWAAVALVLFLLIFQRRRRNRARQRMREELDRWQTSLNHAADRLLEIENQHPLYFVAEPWRWEGQSLELDRACADAVNHLYLLYSKAFELNDKAKWMSKEAEGSWLRHRPFNAVWDVLRHSPVRFETGEVEERRRIFLPLRKSFEGTSTTLLEDLDRAYGEARSHLENVTRIEEQHRQMEAEVQEAVDGVRAEIERRAALDLPTDHLQIALGPALQEMRRIDEDFQRDPVRALVAYEPVLTSLRALHDRTASGNRTVERLRGPVPEMGQKLRREVARLREEGYELEEPGFEPDVELDRGVREASKILDRVAVGDESTAARRLDQLVGQLEDLGENLMAIEKAKEGIPEDLNGLTEMFRALEERIPKARASLEALRREHVVKSFETESDNLDELEKALADIRSLGQEIRESHSAQHYLAALVKLEEAWRLVDLGFQLVDEIDSAQERLNALRDRAQRSIGRCREARSGLSTELQQRGLGNDLRQRFQVWVEDVEVLIERSKQTPLDWTKVEEDATAVEEQLAALRLEAGRRSADYERCLSSLAALAQHFDDLKRRVEYEDRDRPYVARALTEATELLRAFEHELEQDEISGSESLLHLRDVETAFHQARQVWTSEMNLVAEAEQQIDAARRRIRFMSYSRGERAIDRAESLARDREWEEALREAQHAYRLIEQEIHRREEEERRRLAEEERRRRQEAERRRAEQRRAMASSSSSSSSIFASSRSSSSSRSWSSNSGGSSFSRSNSGGSSW